MSLQNLLSNKNDKYTYTYFSFFSIFSFFIFFHHWRFIRDFSNIVRVQSNVNFKFANTEECFYCKSHNVNEHPWESRDVQYIARRCIVRNVAMHVSRHADAVTLGAEERKVALKSIVEQVRKRGSMMLRGGVVSQHRDWKSGIRIILWHLLVYHGVLTS